MLTRSAWAGMQRWGAALWSGDTSSHWPSLKVSIQAGLNTQRTMRAELIVGHFEPRMTDIIRTHP